MASKDVSKMTKEEKAKYSRHLIDLGKKLSQKKTITGKGHLQLFIWIIHSTVMEEMCVEMC